MLESFILYKQMLEKKYMTINTKYEPIFVRNLSFSMLFMNEKLIIMIVSTAA